MLERLTVYEALQMLEKKEASAREMVAATLAKIQDVDESIKAYITVNGEKALLEAESIDKRRIKGEKLGSLAGVPVAVKDNICTSDLPTTCASRMLHDYTPPYDATVISLLRKAGAVVIGKTNLDEFAMGASTENSAMFTTRNPWDRDRVPGGSSGGSAAAVAASEALFALGSDTGGSIRQPASFCGVVGLKPTYGRVSRYGVVAFASSLDQVGPLTKDVRDCSLALGVIGGYDRRDSNSVQKENPDYSAFLGKDVRGLKVGLPREYFEIDIDGGVSQSVQKGIDVLSSLGCELVEISLPHTEYGIAAYYIIGPAEASSNLARFDGVQYGYRAEADNLLDMYKKTRSQGFGEEVKRRIMLGTYALSAGYYDAYYLKALQVRTLIREDFDKAFEKCDIIVTPTAPRTAFRIGEVEDPLAMYLNDIFTVPSSLAGLPALSLPCGFSNGLPVGMQMIGKAFDEELVLQLAYAYEQNSGLPQKTPVHAAGEVEDND